MIQAPIAAIDLGATSGRVMVATFQGGSVQLHEVARFRNGPVQLGAGLHWDILGLYREALDGMARAVRQFPDLASVGVDSWAVDYGLLRGGELLGSPRHYRDPRNADAAAAVQRLVPREELYRRNGLQDLPFTTLFQLAADQATGLLNAADGMLMISDLLHFWLTGEAVTEQTNASTTGLLSVQNASWDLELVRRLGLPASLLPAVVLPGTELGAVQPHVADELGAQLRVIAVGTHDTASSVAAVPAGNADFAYISCGTWGLVGVETEQAVVTEASAAANFTNERGVDGRFRFLRNVMGLWLLNESVAEWQRSGMDVQVAGLVAAAADVTAPVAVFDPNDPEFLPPGAMATRIARHCAERGLPVPASPAETVRAIIESLAAAFAATAIEAARLAGTGLRQIHMLGGGALNGLLCQRTADRAGLPVIAGPVEATAYGNVLVQARALGSLQGSLEAIRAAVSAGTEVQMYLPRTDK